MTKTLPFLFLTLFLVSCGNSGGGGGGSSASKSKPQGDTVSAEEIASNQATPIAAQNWRVNVKMDNFDSVQEDKILIASDLIEKVVASEEFKDAILTHTYKGKKTFYDNGGLTNAEIYKKIIEGSERLVPGNDNEMDLELEVFRRNDDTVGYTKPNVIKVWMNEKFLNSRPPEKVTANMMHEWLHKLGFKHSQNRTAARPFTVPYAVGYLVARLASQV